MIVRTTDPLDPFSEVVDERRRWRPDWYSWLQTVSSSGFTLLEDFGAKGNGVTDDTGAIESALGSGLAVYGGGPDKTYLLSTEIDLVMDGVFFDGQGCTFKWTSALAGSGIAFGGVSERTSTSLAATVTPGDQTVTVSAINDFAVGDLIMIRSTLASTGSIFDLHTKILDIVGSVITLEQAIPRGFIYTQGVDTSLVSGGKAGRRNAFRNVIFDGSDVNTAGTVGLAVDLVTESLFDNLVFLNWIGDGVSGGSFLLTRCSGLAINNVAFDGCGTENIAAFEPGISNSSIDGIYATNSFGFGPELHRGCYLQVSNVNIATTAGRGFKLRGVLDSTFNNILITGAGNTFNALAITAGSSYNRFSNLIILGAPGDTGGGAIWFSDQGSTNNDIVNYVVDGGPGGVWDIHVYPSDVNNSFDNGQVGSLTKITNAGGASLGTLNGVFYARSYVKASLPSAAIAGGTIFVVDDVGGAVPAFSDGTNWRRVTDRNVIS